MSFRMYQTRIETWYSLRITMTDKISYNDLFDHVKKVINEQIENDRKDYKFMIEQKLKQETKS